MINNEFYDELSIHFQNFTPDLDLKEQLRILYRPLRDEAPSDAQLNLKLQQRGLLLKGTMKICSSQQTFVAIGYANQALPLAQQLKKDLHRQIIDWKKTRFTAMAV